MEPAAGHSDSTTDEEIISTSRRKHCYWLLACLGVFAFGIFLLVVEWPFNQRGWQILRSAKTALGGLLGIVIGSWGSLYFSWSLLLHALRLRLTERKLELITLTGKVVGSVPYENMARVEIVEEDGEPSIGIWLHNLNSPDTFWYGGRIVRVMNKIHPGYDVGLMDEWEVSLEKLCTKIRARVGEDKLVRK